MENRNLEKALDILSALLMGEKVASQGNNAMLYEEYSHNSEVYDILMQIMKKLNVNLYEYNNTLFLCAGNNNRIFGYSNEELKKIMGLRLNRELFLTYFIMYGIITEFYKDSAGSTYLEYIKIEDIIRLMDALVSTMIDTTWGISKSDADEESFKSIALLWDELPLVSADDKSGARAARSSKSGFVKITMNFLESQGIFAENEGRYYPMDRFRAIAENYFENNKGRLYEILNGGEDEDATD